MVSDRYSFFSPRYGPVSALRVFHAHTRTFDGALARHDVLNILRELATDARRGDRSDLAALSKMVGPEMLAGRAATDRLLDGLTRAIDRGTLVLVQGWGTAGTTASSPEQGRGNESLVARAMGEAREIAFEGERYVVKTSASWRQFPDQLFEALRPDVARGVLARLASRPRWSKDQKAALEEVGTKLADPAKPESQEAGLVLLRRGSFGATSLPPEAATAAVTPSQAVKPTEEKVDPVMDARMVDLDMEEVELPVEETAAEDPEAPEDDAAAGDAETSEPGGEPAAPEGSDDSSDPGAQ
jgi:hypothetical protein